MSAPVEQRQAPMGTRQAILDAARQRFLHYGYKKTTIDEIAADAGVGKGTVYLYFGGKEDLLLTLVVEVKRAITEQMRGIATSAAAPPDKLREMMAARVLAVYDACKSTAHGIELVDYLRPQLSHCGREEYEAQQGLLADVLREGHKIGVFDIADAPRAAHLLSAALLAFFPPYICPPFPTDRSREELEAGAREMVGFLVRGLRRCR